MNLSGALTDWTVADLLSMLTVTKKAATLRIEGDRSGLIHFSDGLVVGAILDDEPDDDYSRSATADALYALSGLASGTFDIGAFTGPVQEGWSVETLTEDITQLKNLESDLANSGLIDFPIMLSEEISGPVTISPEDWWAIASLVSVLSMGQLEAVFGRGRATRLLHTLWRLDLVETVELPDDQEAGQSEDDDDPAVASYTNEALEEVTDEENQLEDADLDDGPEIAVSSGDEDAWLDEIAANAGGDLTEEQVHRRLTGVSAPASTVLTGSVLDEMRRLRSRPSGE